MGMNAKIGWMFDEMWVAGKMEWWKNCMNTA